VRLRAKPQVCCPVAFHPLSRPLANVALALLGWACASEPRNAPSAPASVSSPVPAPSSLPVAPAAPSSAPSNHKPIRESLIPVEVPGVRGARRLALSEDGTWALTGDGDLFYWGLDATKYSDNADLPDSGLPPPRVVEPALVAHVHGVTEVSADDWACALVAGAATCFGLQGDHFYGTIDRRHATSMGVFGTQILASYDCGCVLGADGSVTCWELSPDEPLPARNLVVEPTHIDGLVGVRAISGNGGSLFATLSDGTVREIQVSDAICKGRGCPPRPTAKRIAGLADVADVVGSAQAACALRRDGTVACWNLESRVAAITPVRELSAVAQLTGRDGSYCARLTDGSVRCWGSNAFGLLGDGTKINRPSPVVVRALTNVVDVAIGERHACAVVADGTVRCWGLNDSGQLGAKPTR
jgi:hypothetical protein